MGKRVTLLIDAFINLVLGLLLLAFNPSLASFLGVPTSPSPFYPNILGGVFIGITLALVMEALRKPGEGDAGLGRMGAVSINLCGGGVLFLWLIFGGLDLPLRGVLLLWGLAILLPAISLVELIPITKKRTNRS
jgi:hypothetical protein